MKLFNSVLFLVVLCFVSITGLSQNDREPKKPVLRPLEAAIIPEKPAAEVKPTVKAELPIKRDDEVRETRYRIGLLDQLEVTVARHPELSLIVAVNEQGSIKLARADKPFVVFCKTESEVQAEIIKEYSKFLREPFVNVRVVQQNSQPFAVIGAVEKPGSFYLNRKISLYELLSFAGGPKVEKAGTKVQIARVGGTSGCEQESDTNDDNFKNLFETYSLKDVYALNANPWLRPGDIVRVLQADEVYVIGNVFKPQAIVLKEGLTVSQAIAASGGTLSATKKNQILIRRQRNGVNETVLVDLDRINKKEIQDIPLLAEDIVDVPTDKSRKLFSDIFRGFTQGIPVVLSRPF